MRTTPPSLPDLVLVILPLKLVQTLQGTIRRDLQHAKDWSFRPGQSQRTRKERAKTVNSRECTNGLAQRLTDAKSRQFHGLGGIARGDFVGNKALGQISCLRGKNHFRSVAVQNGGGTWT